MTLSTSSLYTVKIKSVVNNQHRILRWRSNQIFSSFTALIKGFALAISSRPTFLKSKPHPCLSGYLWTPQNVTPHLHLNPVNPTRFRHDPHRFGNAATATSDPEVAAAELAVTSGDGEVNGGGSDSTAGDGDGGAAEERAVSMEDWVEACCCSFKRKSL